MNARLAAEVECTHAVIGQYLSEESPKKSIDALLLFALCDELSVTPYWLALGQGTIDDVQLETIPMQELRKVAR